MLELEYVTNISGVATRNTIGVFPNGAKFVPVSVI
jgi:hypothetical protein